MKLLDANGETLKEWDVLYIPHFGAEVFVICDYGAGPVLFSVDGFNTADTGTARQSLKIGSSMDRPELAPWLYLVSRWKFD